MRKKNFFAPSLESVDNTEHGPGCGCGLCIDEEPDLMPDNTPLSVLAVDVAESEFDYQKAEEQAVKLEEAAVALENICDAIKESASNNYCVTPSDGAMLHITINSIQHTLGIPGRSLPALECFTIDSELSMQLSLEGLGDFLIRVWEAIKSALVKLYKAIVDFIKKLLGYNKAMDRQAERNKQALLLLGRNPPTETPVEPLSLTASAIAVLWDAKSNGISKDLVSDINRYKEMFVNCFSAYVENQMQSDVATRNILDNVIRRADTDLERGRKKDEKIAKDLIAYADKKLNEAMSVLVVQRQRIFAPYHGTYIGGLVVNAKTDPNDDSNFVWLSSHIDSHAKLPAMTLDGVNALNTVMADLQIAYINFVNYAYEDLERTLQETTDILDAKVQELTANYGDFPKMLQAFQVALQDNKTETNKLINTIFKIVSHTSKLCAEVTGNVIPALIESLEDAQDK